MSRWKPDAQGRLVSAAIELFDEQGYEATTVAEIAERGDGLSGCIGAGQADDPVAVVAKFGDDGGGDVA